MGKPVNSLITLRAYLLDRKTGKIVMQRSWKNRIPMLLLVKLSAWIFSLEDEYPREKYKLIVSLEGKQDERTEFLRNKFRELGIKIVEEVINDVV